MKIKSIKREAHIGTSIELSNVEQIVLATKLNDVSKFMLDKHGKVHNIIKLSVDQSEKLNDLVIFINKLTKDTCSLQEAHNELFFDKVDATDHPIKDKVIQMSKIELNKLENYE